LTTPPADATKISIELLGGLPLAVHPSVIKRHQQSLKRRVRNSETKSKLRTLIKKARQALDGTNRDAALSQIRAVNKALSKAVSKGALKSNTASRWLSRLSRSATRIATPS
jgi:small subunit ribosomal protein S20